MNEIQNKQYCDNAIALKENIETNYLRLAEVLKIIRDQRLYQPMHSTFKEFMMELDISEGTASKMIQVWDKLVNEYEIPESEIVAINGWSKAYLIAKNVKTKDEAVEFVERAKIATRGHLEADIKEKYQGVDQDKCPHEFRTLKTCKKCNYKYEEFSN